MHKRVTLFLLSLLFSPAGASQAVPAAEANRLLQQAMTHTLQHEVAEIVVETRYRLQRGQQQWLLVSRLVQGHDRIGHYAHVAQALCQQAQYRQVELEACLRARLTQRRMLPAG